MDAYAANQNKEIVKKRKGCPKLGEIIKKAKANICIAVLLLAMNVTFTGFCPCFSVKSCLNEETTISLKIIIMEGIINKRSLS